jgi:peptidoglycan/LPS O-acetylase OafA/YrhL
MIQETTLTLTHIRERPETLGRSKPSRYYRPELDGVRCVAFFLVFIHHALRSILTMHPRLFAEHREIAYAIANTAGFGLSLFFALSAFLITELLVRERAKTGTVNVKAFYIRRILRIWPLYFLAIGIGLAQAYRRHLIGVDGPLFLAYALLCGNWYQVFVGAGDTPFGPLWSISVEEQFYLFWPFLSKVCNRKNLQYAVGGLLALSVIALIYLGVVHSDTEDAWSNSFVQFGTFGAGGAVALWLHGRVPLSGAVGRVGLFCSAVIAWFVACAVFGIKTPGPSSVLGLFCGYCLAAVGCVLILIAALGLDASLLPKPVLYLGRISYGLYVFHLFCVDLVTNFLSSGNSPSVNQQVIGCSLGLLLDIGVASISYAFFEKRFIKLKDRFAVIHTSPAS